MITFRGHIQIIFGAGGNKKTDFLAFIILANNADRVHYNITFLLYSALHYASNSGWRELQ